MTNVFTGATQGLPFTITYNALRNVAHDNSPDGDPVSFLIDAVYTGTVTKNGVPVIPGTTTLSAGETLVFTPTSIVSGANVLGIRAYDGELVSQNVVPVWFNFATNVAPTLSTINTLSLAHQDQPFTVTYAALATAANAVDANGNPLSFRVETVSSGTLTKNGVAVVPGSTLLSAGEELIWTPPPGINAQGVNMFTVRAWDGLLASSSAVQVKVNFNRPPTLTSMSTLTGANEDQPRTITFTGLESAGNEADPDGNPLSFRIESVIAGTLTKNGVAVVPGVTIVSSGDSLVWTPPINAFGIVAAFRVVAWDGYLASSSPKQVNVNVTASNNAPIAVNNGPYYVVTPGESLTLSAIGSYDPDSNDVVGIFWDLNGDNNFSDAVGINPTLTWAQLQSLGLTSGATFRQIKLRVADITHSTTTEAITYLQMPLTPVTPGFSEDFEATLVTQLGPEWGFLPVGTGVPSIVSYDSQSGNKSLRLGQSTTQGFSSVSAILSRWISRLMSAKPTFRYSFWSGDSNPDDRMNLYVSGDGTNTDFNSRISLFRSASPSRSLKAIWIKFSIRPASRSIPASSSNRKNGWNRGIIDR
ncbi:MAG: hypothetical protein U1D30_11335 [Planctomycetota bacterium]